MKLLSKNTGYLNNVEKYDLNHVFSESVNNKGLTICYTLATYTEAKMISLELSAMHEEVGVPVKWHKKYSYKTFTALFSSFSHFLTIYDGDDFGRWTLVLNYQNTDIAISGERKSTEISLSYPQNKGLDLILLLNEIETKTYEFNNYNTEILDILKTDYEMTTKRAVLTMRKLLTHDDIYTEFFLTTILKMSIKPSLAIMVEGYTAEKLHSSYPLSVLGSYMFLIYLRERTEEALEDLKKGLPCKDTVV